MDIMKYRMIAGTVAAVGLAAAGYFNFSALNKRAEERVKAEWTEAMENLQRAGITADKIDVPQEIRTKIAALEPGYYQLTLPTDKGPRECTATVMNRPAAFKFSDIALACK